ncbi:restriction endonuclease [Mycobacterium sp. TY815]|uniref:restriction endonuclease n=1 Tax=unclassified Mycobacterium TaxID=2642494 RepID=UPI002740DE2C|nr:restriction endonuclease [Mycobacterium sp. TY815]MDP7706937.1 restriction endonuclease [Mycobacterium sp. TY815]
MTSVLDWRAEFAVLDALPPDATPTEKAKRGHRLEKILHAMLDDAGLSPRLSYRPEGEEIDGSFVIAGRTMLLEAKWTAEPQPASALYQFTGKISGKLVGTVGLFVSMSGVSPDAIDALIAGKQLNLILMDGDDLRAIARDDITIHAAIRAKLRVAAETGAAFFAVGAGAPRRRAEDTREVVLVEGRIDEHILSAVIRSWGTRAERQSVVPVGGPSNFGPTAEALLPHSVTVPKFVVVADGDQTGVKARIQRDLADRAIKAKVVIVEPGLESALGILEPGTEQRRRRELRVLDDQVILSRIQYSLETGRVPAQVNELFSLLGIRVPWT